MRNMSLIGKVEAHVEIKADAAAFHDVFSCNPHHTTKASPDKILACDLHEGVWGISGYVVNWNFVHDGKAKNSKAEVAAIDDVNNSTTYKVLEGDLMEEFKSFAATVEATAKGDGEGSVVHWAFQYEKLNGDVPDPLSLLHLMIHLSKDIDAHLCLDKFA